MKVRLCLANFDGRIIIKMSMDECMVLIGLVEGIFISVARVKAAVEESVLATKVLSIFFAKPGIERQTNYNQIVS